MVLEAEHDILDYFDHVGWPKTIILKDHARVNYVAVVYDSTVDIKFVCEGVSCHADVCVITISDNGLSSGGTVNGILSNNHAAIDIHMVSILTDGSIINADGCIDIRPGVSKVSGTLLEEYLVIGTDVRIKTLPMLDVQSCDVSASHWARIQRIDDKNLFYIMSKGISQSDARSLIISGMITSMFDAIRDSDEQIVNDVQQRVISLINNTTKA